MSIIRSAPLALILALTCGLTAQAQQIDLSTMVQAPPSVNFGEGVKVGYRVEIETKVGSTNMSSFTAVVGETEDAWEVESTQMLAAYASMPGGKGLVMAMAVDKKTLEVLSAKIGVPGGELKDVKIMKLPEKRAKPQGQPLGTPEEFTLPSGKKVMARVSTSKAGGQTYTSWVGAKGTKFEGLLLGFKGANSSRTLSADPVEVDHELQDQDKDGKARTVVGRQVAYTDGSQVVMTKDPVAKCMHFGLLSSKTPHSELKVISLRTDAKRTLAWK